MFGRSVWDAPCAPQTAGTVVTRVGVSCRCRRPLGGRGGIGAGSPTKGGSAGPVNSQRGGIADWGGSYPNRRSIRVALRSLRYLIRPRVGPKPTARPCGPRIRGGFGRIGHWWGVGRVSLGVESKQPRSLPGSPGHAAAARVVWPGRWGGGCGCPAPTTPTNSTTEKQGPAPRQPKYPYGYLCRPGAGQQAGRRGSGARVRMLGAARRSRAGRSRRAVHAPRPGVVRWCRRWRCLVRSARGCRPIWIVR